MIKKIANHHITKKTVKGFRLSLQAMLFLLLPIVICTFLASKTTVFGYQSFVVLTGSMQPTIDPGSVVYVKKDQFYNEGDIVSFTIPSGQTVTHRIQKIVKRDGAVQYQTKGDANRVVDSEVVTNDKVLGKVAFSLPYLGQVILFIRTPLGFITTILFPIILFVFAELWVIKAEIEKHVEKRVMEKLQPSKE